MSVYWLRMTENACGSIENEFGFRIQLEIACFYFDLNLFHSARNRFYPCLNHFYSARSLFFLHIILEFFFYNFFLFLFLLVPSYRLTVLPLFVKVTFQR